MCNTSLLFNALYAKCPYYVVLYMQSILIIACFNASVSGAPGQTRTKRAACGQKTYAAANGSCAAKYGARPSHRRTNARTCAGEAREGEVEVDCEPLAETRVHVHVALFSDLLQAGTS